MAQKVQKCGICGIETAGGRYCPMCEMKSRILFGARVEKAVSAMSKKRK